MNWFDKIIDAVDTATAIGERVERLGGSVADLAKDLRDVDRRVARLEGAMSAQGSYDSWPVMPSSSDDPM